MAMPLSFRVGVCSLRSQQFDRSLLLLAVVVGAVVSSCDDDPSHPNSVPNTSPPEYQAEWEMDTWSVTVDDQGNLHVAQFWEPDILKYSKDGELIGRSFVVLDMDTVDVCSLAYADGRIVALAWGDVVVLDTTYSVITSWPERHNRNGCGGGDRLDVDGSGNIYVLDDDRDLVVKYGPDGTFKTEWTVKHTDSSGNGFLSGIAVSDGGRVFVSDAWRNRIVVYASDGRLLFEFGKHGSHPSELDGPRGLDVSAGFLYVADSANFRIKKFNLYGQYVSDFYSRGTHGQSLDAPESVDVFGKIVFVMHENSILRFDYGD